jgi:hypothetical protein
MKTKRREEGPQHELDNVNVTKWRSTASPPPLQLQFVPRAAGKSHWSNMAGVETALQTTPTATTPQTPKTPETLVTMHGRRRRRHQQTRRKRASAECRPGPMDARTPRESGQPGTGTGGQRQRGRRKVVFSQTRGKARRLRIVPQNGDSSQSCSSLSQAAVLRPAGIGDPILWKFVAISVLCPRAFSSFSQLFLGFSLVLSRYWLPAWPWTWDG